MSKKEKTILILGEIVSEWEFAAPFISILQCSKEDDKITQNIYDLIYVAFENSKNEFEKQKFDNIKNALNKMNSLEQKEKEEETIAQENFLESIT